MDALDLLNLVSNVVLAIVFLIGAVEGIGYALMRYWKKYRWAVSYYSALLKLLPSSTTLYVNRSWAWLCLHEFDRTLDDCARAIKMDDQMAMAHNNRAAAYLGLNRCQDALWAAQRALQLDGKLWSAYYNRGYALYRLNACEHALRDFSICIEQRPPLADQYLHRANCYLHLQQYPQAIQDYTRCIELDPRSWNAYHNRSYAYFAIGETELAHVDITRACEGNPQELMHRLWMEWCAFCTDPQITAARVEAITELSSFHVEVPYFRHLQQGILHWLRGEYEQALQRFEQGIECEHFYNENSYLWSGMSLAALGRYEEAGKAIAHALSHGMPRPLLATLTLLKEEEHASFIEQYPL